MSRGGQRGGSRDITFSAARLRALGKVIYDDIDMWPFDGIRSEHHDIVPEVLQEVVTLMGYEPTEKDLAAVLDEVAEYRRTIKGMGLLGAGKVTEILRYIHDIASSEEAKRVLVSLDPLQETLAHERQREQNATPEQVGELRVQHRHPEFLRVAESIIEELLAAKRVLKQMHSGMTPAAERALLAIDAAIAPRLWSLRWVLRCAAPRRWFDAQEALHDDLPAAAWWVKSFGQRQTSVPITAFIAALAASLDGALDGNMQEQVRLAADRCGDGVVTVHHLQQLLSRFGPFPDLVDNIGFAVAGRLMSWDLSEEQARRACVAEGAGTFTFVFGEQLGELLCCWADRRRQPVSCVVTRASGAWVGRGLGAELPAFEILSEVAAAHAAVWRTPLAAAVQLPEVYRRPRDDTDGTASLHRAAASNNAGLVRALLRNGGALVIDQRTWEPEGAVDPRLYNAQLTPLLAAVATRIGDPLDVCRLLIAAGADVNAADARGHTGLYRAILHRRWEVIDLLREAGARLETAPGTVPLFLCLGPHARNGWYKHNLVFRNYKPCVHTLGAVLRFYVTQSEVSTIAVAEEALDITQKKLAMDPTPPEGLQSEHTVRMEEISRQATQQHSQRFARDLRPLRRALQEFLYTERLRRLAEQC
eukprot:TRINITY_DN3514_c0_g2_i1.p1 TRINITY_DN3514_c0_g2~~TRINITY_DN3514_c0_g2_i1.p1  ORF type:complete len:646 (+),score=214.83 TRINITY_DN3514_c0_g2_i1:73-2010(+)